MNAESASEPSNSSESLFGDAAPSSETEQAAGSDTFSGGGDAAGGWNEPDRAFTEPPPDAGGSGEETWKEDSFGSAGDAPDGGGDLGDLGDMAGGEGASGVIETLKKLYTFFGGGGD